MIVRVLVGTLFLATSAVAQPWGGSGGMMQSFIQPPPPNNTSCGLTPGPAGLQGFSTCALNSDFTQPLPTGYINCTIPPNPTPSATWYVGVDWGSTPATQMACGVVSQKTDPSFGNLALDMQYQSQYAGTNKPELNTVNIQTVSPSYPTTGGTFFPHGYFEAVYRFVHPPTFNNWQTAWWTPGGEHGDSHIEFDFTETWSDRPNMNGNMIDGTHTSLNIIQMYAINYGTGPGQIDLSQYHKFAVLVTGNGATEAGCAYVDDKFQGCASTPVLEAFNPHYVQMWNSVHCSENVNDTSSCLTANSFGNTDVWVKSIRIWSCVNWQTDLCQTPPKTSGP